MMPFKRFTSFIIPVPAEIRLFRSGFRIKYGINFSRSPVKIKTRGKTPRGSFYFSPSPKKYYTPQVREFILYSTINLTSSLSVCVSYRKK
jgi:hypothetical protein